MTVTSPRGFEEELLQLLFRQRRFLADVERVRTELVNAQVENRGRLDELEAAVAQARAHIESGGRSPVLELRTSQRAATTTGSPPDADYLLSQSGWGDLLTVQELQEIERRTLLPTYSLGAWDRWDFMAVGGAGLLAALYDIFVVAIPKDMPSMGLLASVYGGQKAGVTPWLKRLTDVPNDNPLARWFKVPYDNMSLPGMNARDHRLWSLGHDPVVGFLAGVWDILTGQMHAFDRDGAFHVVEGLGHRHSNLTVAFIVQLGHLLSDAFTKQGIPPPGFGLLHGLHVGSFGQKGRTVGELVRWMYLNGFDLRHFSVQTGSPALVELVVRGYLLLRDFVGQADVLADPVVQAQTEAKREAMLVWGHAIAALANAGKVYVMAGNPMAINYSQWLALFGKLALMARSTLLASPVDDLEAMTRRTIRAWHETEAVELSADQPAPMDQPATA